MRFSQDPTGWHQGCFDELKFVVNRILVLCFCCRVYLNRSRSPEVCCLSISCVQLWSNPLLLSLSFSLPLISAMKKRHLLVLFRCFLKGIKSSVVSVHNAASEHVGHLLTVCWTHSLMGRTRYWKTLAGRKSVCLSILKTNTTSGE